jgi:hypothetical protein
MSNEDAYKDGIVAAYKAGIIACRFDRQQLTLDQRNAFVAGFRNAAVGAELLQTYDYSSTGKGPQ